MLPIKPFKPSLLLFLLSALASGESPAYGTVLVDTVYRVYDGDTFFAGIVSWPDIVGHRIGIRIAGIDTPELRDKRPRIKNLARRARALADSALTNAQKVELRAIRRGKYFRVVADVYCDGRSLARLLIDAGLAHPYDGEKKVSW